MRGAGFRVACHLSMAALTMIAVPLPGMATIISGEVTGGTASNNGGTFVKLTPPLPNPFKTPNSVGNDTFQSFNLFGFDEDQNIVLPGPLAVDVGTSPLAAGTVVASHYVFFDPTSGSIVGTVNFNSDVLAVITSTGNLAASDFLLNTGVDYLNPGLRGLEGGDSVTISGPRQIRFATTASTPGDYVRVLTAFSPPTAVPEPSSEILLGSGLTLWMVRMRRKSGMAQ